MTDLLEIDDLRIRFEGAPGHAVDGVSITVPAGRRVGIIGESGSGKSVTAMSILRLNDERIMSYSDDSAIRYRGEDLLTAPASRLRQVRGAEISVIFQEPMTSLNPVFQVGDQIGEALRLHRGMTRSQARERTIELLREVGIPSPETRVDEYPHQLSGGMKQRVMIAMALACDPSLLIADEPTTALDVTIQAQILDLLRNLQREKGMAILLITHDLGVIAENADHVVVMYAGKIVEYAPVDVLFSDPKHPYTIGLFRSLPRLGNETERLEVIEGNVPNPLEFPSGCKFWPRCPRATDLCRRDEPELLELEDGRTAACHHITESDDGGGDER